MFPCGSSPRSACLADSSPPATPRLLAAASSPPFPLHRPERKHLTAKLASPQSESLLGGGTSKGAISNVVVRGHF